MDNNHYKGQLKRWNDGKGFGFIGLENGQSDIFIHISALKKINRRPIIGDVVIFQVETDGNGKKRAVNAKIEGVTAIQAKARRKNVKTKNNKFVSQLISIMLLIFIGMFVFSKIVEKSDSSVVKSSSISFSRDRVKNASNFTCRGKTYCSEMSSCEEAKFYQNNCQGTKMDGDGDGIPCESQWCSL